MDRKSFDKTRIILTSWYVGILAIILFSFSFVLYSGEQRDFARIIVQRDFRGRILRQLTSMQHEEVNEQLIALRTGFVVNLLIVDMVVLSFGGALSFFLAGKTLSPIQETLQKQKLFLADVSHEIRTPLAAIQTATEVALRSKEKSKDAYKHVLAQVYSETKRLTKMANDLLFLSRMESESTTLRNVSFSEVVQEVVDAFTPVVEEKNISLRCTIEKNITVVGNPDGLRQLVMIFLDNAIKYTQSGGKITVGLASLPRPTLTIVDTGIGIAKDNQKKIFERFFRVDSSRSQDGNGLGLAIAQQIIQRNKIKLSMKSTLGKGTEFTFVFL